MANYLRHLPVISARIDSNYFGYRYSIRCGWTRVLWSSVLFPFLGLDNKATGLYSRTKFHCIQVVWPTWVWLQHVCIQSLSCLPEVCGWCEIQAQSDMYALPGNGMIVYMLLGMEAFDYLGIKILSGFHHASHANNHKALVAMYAKDNEEYNLLQKKKSLPLKTTSYR